MNTDDINKIILIEIIPIIWSNKNPAFIFYGPIEMGTDTYSIL